MPRVIKVCHKYRCCCPSIPTDPYTVVLTVPLFHCSLLHAFPSSSQLNITCTKSGTKTNRALVKFNAVLFSDSYLGE